MAQYNDQMPSLLSGASYVSMERDPRRAPSTPLVPSGVYGAGDFIYVGAGFKGNTPTPSEVIVLYDQPDLGRHRLVAFADGHVQRFDPGSPELQAVIDQNNILRTGLSLPPLPRGLAGAPPLPPATAPVPP